MNQAPTKKESLLRKNSPPPYKKEALLRKNSPLPFFHYLHFQCTFYQKAKVELTRLAFLYITLLTTDE